MQLVLVIFLALALPALAADLWSSADGSRYWALDSALKWTSLLSRSPEAPLFYPERWSSASLWRGRLALGGQVAERLHLRVAYEQRARLVSKGAGLGGGAGILLSEGEAPYRVEPVDKALVTVGETFAYHHELDRALIAWRVGRGELQLGRQAIGWGRGVLFGAVDIFAPFNPLESDREWRRGIDALRVSLPLGDLFSLEGVAALGASVDESAFVGRLSGYFGEVDGELLLGRRRRDLFVGAVWSLPVKDAEMHGELAVFKTPEPITVTGSDRVMKVLVGGSYAWDVQGGLMLLGEYHFSGFGLEDTEELVYRILDPDYRERLALGDAQILGRHAGAVQLLRGIGSSVPLTLGWIFAPTDGSGVLTSVVTWVFSDALTLAASAYWPYGKDAGPISLRNEDASAATSGLRSEYGGAATSGLLQIRFHY